MTKVFIDGSAGTAGLQIHSRIKARSDIELITIPYEQRHDSSARKEALNAADIAFLCLPDEASIESVALMDEGNDHTVIIDTSTAHRTAASWAYGFPELSGRREQILASKRIANPGCHASGFISLTQPLVQAGIIPKALGLQCFSVTGYSGGGKKMIAQYENADREKLLDSPRLYGTGQVHKHLKEMTKISGLETPPIFCPIVADYYSGMETVVPLFANDIKGTAEDIKAVYKSAYSGAVVHFEESADEGGLFAANAFAGRDDMEITVSGNDERILLISRFDNLGKGASGAAVQNMNLVMGVAETTGLVLGESK